MESHLEAFSAPSVAAPWHQQQQSLLGHWFDTGPTFTTPRAGRDQSQPKGGKVNGYALFLTVYFLEELEHGAATTTTPITGGSHVCSTSTQSCFAGRLYIHLQHFRNMRPPQQQQQQVSTTSIYAPSSFQVHASSYYRILMLRFNRCIMGHGSHHQIFSSFWNAGTTRTTTLASDT